MTQQSIPLDRQKERLVAAAEQEARVCAIDFPLYLDQTSVLCLIANLQLALRHPGNTGASAAVARKFVDGMISRMKDAGLVATAELARLGDDPAYDDPAPP